VKIIESRRTVRVLVVEDSLPGGQRLRALIESSGHATIVGTAATGTTALALFRTHQPDAVVLDLELAEGMSYTVLEEIKQTNPDCEVIVLTNLARPEHRARCRQLGADHLFEKSQDFDRVSGVLAGVGRAKKSAGRILVADDEALVGHVLIQFLERAGFECEWVSDATGALHAVGRSRFDLLIADVNMPGNRQLELLQKLPAVAPGLPVILLTGDPQLDSAAAAVRFRANAYLTKPPELVELHTLAREAIANYRIHQAVRRKWDQFQSLTRDLTQQLAGNTSGDPSEVQELERLFQALNDVIQAGKVNPPPTATPMSQHLELVGAVRETIAVLAQTKRAFKSKQLGELRARLETLVRGIGGGATDLLPNQPNHGPAHQALAT